MRKLVAAQRLPILEGLAAHTTAQRPGTRLVHQPQVTPQRLRAGQLGVRAQRAGVAPPLVDSLRVGAQLRLGLVALRTLAALPTTSGHTAVARLLIGILE